MIVRPTDILSIDTTNLPHYSKDAIDFAKEWLDGKQSFIVATSGSTGTPKKIEIHRDQMISSAKKTIAALGLREGMTALVCLDVKYIAGKMMVVRSLVAGMNMIIVEPKAVPFADVDVENIDIAALIPFQIAHTLDSPQRKQLDSIRKIIIGGSSLSSPVLEDIQKISAECYATFGMTETLSHIALQKLNGADKQDFFVTLEGIDISTDERECLVIKADYLNDLIVTNDIIELIDKKRFRWLGRADTVINSGSVKIFPESIEKKIDDYFDSKNINNLSIAFGAPHEQLGQQVVLVIEGMLSKGQEKSLMNHLKETLGRYEMPKQILYIEQFQRTKTGKVDRRHSFLDALPRSKKFWEF